MNFFSYGIFRRAEALLSVTGVAREPIPAVLMDYRRVSNYGPEYVLPCAGAVVEGVLYEDLPEAAWLPLDRIEGTSRRNYDRVEAVVRLGDGTPVAVQVYVAGPETTKRIEEYAKADAKAEATWKRRGARRSTLTVLA